MLKIVKTTTNCVSTLVETTTVALTNSIQSGGNSISNGAKIMENWTEVELHASEELKEYRKQHRFIEEVKEIEDEVGMPIEDISDTYYALRKRLSNNKVAPIAAE